MDRPRIVVTLSRHDTERNRTTRRQYLASVSDGAQAIAVTPSDRAPDDFDGLYLSGGEDIDPARYGEPVAGSELIDVARDELEFDLLAQALERDVPVLGICRGFQVLNVHFGGSLEQHVVGHRAKELGIPNDPEGPDAMKHLVRAEPPSLLAAACGSDPFTVNSSHHQVVTPARFAKRVLRATVMVDGLVEALESGEHRWVVGVQWHPERAAQVDPAAARIFQAFVRAAERVPAR